MNKNYKLFSKYLNLIIIKENKFIKNYCHFNAYYFLIYINKIYIINF